MFSVLVVVIVAGENIWGEKRKKMWGEEFLFDPPLFVISLCFFYWYNFCYEVQCVYHFLFVRILESSECFLFEESKVYRSLRKVVVGCRLD